MAVRLGALIVSLTGLITALNFGVPNLTAVEYESNHQTQVDTGSTEKFEEDVVVETKDTRPVVRHVPLPEHVKTIYMSACVVGTPDFRQRLVQLVQETEINSIIIDVKDYSGTISFPPESDAWKPAWQTASCGTTDMRAFLEMLHDNHIYAIARVTVFQDPFYTKVRPDLAVKKADGVTVWKDNKGLSFIDVGATEYWNHIIELSRDIYNVGFDEINYDYIRYPSDGPMFDIAFTHADNSEYGKDKQANLEAFFAYLHEKVSDPELYAAYRHESTGREEAIPYTSADLFGMTTTNFDDLSIGQVQDRAAPYFDFIAPMVYPSHYPDNSFGYGNPNNHPYEIVHYAMSQGVQRMESDTTPMEGFKHEPITTTNASGTVTFTGMYTKPVYSADKFRTWIQDFDYGGVYDAADVRAQIQASYDAGVNSWMIWAPSNIYTKAALQPADYTVSSSTQ